jgi:hypothetical protein
VGRTSSRESSLRLMRTPEQIVVMALSKGVKSTE